jgi:hypothetical protein
MMSARFVQSRLAACMCSRQQRKSADSRRSLRHTAVQRMCLGRRGGTTCSNSRTPAADGRMLCLSKTAAERATPALTWWSGRRRRGWRPVWSLAPSCRSARVSTGSCQRHVCRVQQPGPGRPKWTCGTWHAPPLRSCVVPLPSKLRVSSAVVRLVLKLQWCGMVGDGMHIHAPDP